MADLWTRRLLRLKHAYEYHHSNNKCKDKKKRSISARESEAQRAYDAYYLAEYEYEVCDEYQLIKVGGDYAYQDNKDSIFVYDDHAGESDGYTYRADLSEEYKDVYVFERFYCPYHKITIVYNSDGTLYKSTNKEYDYADEGSNTKRTEYYPENTTVEQILQSK